MKKTIILLLALFVTLSAVGCTQTAAEKTPSGTPEELLEQLYANVDSDLIPMVGNVEITAENEAYYIGATGLKYDSAMASEAMIGSIAYSVALVRLTDGEDASAAVTAIKEQVNPRKWICVEAETVIVDHAGQLVILIMAEDATAQALYTGFKTLAGK